MNAAERGGESHDDTLTRRARDGPRNPHRTPPKSATGARRDGPSRDHPCPRPDPDPARGAARAGEPAGVPPGSGVRRPDAGRDRPVEGALPHRERRCLPDDLVGDRRPRVRGPERLLAGRRGASAARRVLLGALEQARGGARPGRSQARVRMGSQDRARGGRGRARRASGQGGPAHALRDLDRRDPADPRARPRGERGRRARGRGRGLEPGGGAVRVRRVGDRRRGRRLAEGALGIAGDRVRRDLAARVGDATHGDDAPLLLRLVDLQGVRRAQAIPRTRGRPRSA